MGDCCQELVFIDIGMDEVELYESLPSCLLTDAEVSLGIEAWLEFDDPFPSGISNAKMFSLLRQMLE